MTGHSERQLTRLGAWPRPQQRRMGKCIAILQFLESLCHHHCPPRSSDQEGARGVPGRVASGER